MKCDSPLRLVWPSNNLSKKFTLDILNKQNIYIKQINIVKYLLVKCSQQLKIFEYCLLCVDA